MEQISKLIIRDDVYNILVPIMIAMIAGIFQVVNERAKKEKQWKVLREKSAVERYNKYFLFMILSGILFVFLYIVSIYLIEKIIGVSLGEIFIKVSYPIYTTLVYIYIGSVLVKNDIVFRKKYKYKKQFTFILSKVPIFFSWLIWTFILYETIVYITKISIVFITLYEVFYMIVLDNKNNYRYRYATFYFYNDRMIENIYIHNIFQKGNWIVAKEVGEIKEYRFRIKDVERIEYTNLNTTFEK